MSRFFRYDLGRKFEILAWLGAPIVLGVFVLSHAPLYAPANPIVIQDSGAFSGRLVSFQ